MIITVIVIAAISIAATRVEGKVEVNGGLAYLLFGIMETIMWINIFGC